MGSVLEGSSEAVDVVLRDGATARLRPASRDDRGAVAEFYQRLSPESRYAKSASIRRLRLRRARACRPRVDLIVQARVLLTTC